MTEKVTIAIDAMGGDFGPSVTVPAALKVLPHHQNVHLVFVGKEAEVNRILSDNAADKLRVSVVNATQTVEMDDLPSQALRTKKDSSMRISLNMVRDGEADACVSAGNTGALMATARFVLKTLPGIDRPAIITTLPAIHGVTHVLDLGANVGSSSEHLLQFAIMGSALARLVDGIESPRVGLLNIGEEEIKGNDQIKRAGQLISKSNLNYVGFVEGDDIFSGEIDVVVCDGFVGNVALKTTEGVAKMIRQSMKDAFLSSVANRICGMFALPVLKKFRESIDPRRHNGASLLGLRGIVVKSHGGADQMAFSAAINVAISEVEKQIPKHIEQDIENLLLAEEAE